MKVYPSPDTIPARFHLPPERHSITHKFNVGDFEGYLTVGLYSDGRPGEVYITACKEGSALSGILNALAISISIGLQSGVPVERYTSKFKHMRFEPMGFTSNQEIRSAASVVDYVAKWMDEKFRQVVAAEDTAIAVSIVAPPVAAGEPAANGNGKGNGNGVSIVPDAVPMSMKSK